MSHAQPWDSSFFFLWWCQKKAFKSLLWTPETSSLKNVLLVVFLQTPMLTLSDLSLQSGFSSKLKWKGPSNCKMSEVAMGKGFSPPPPPREGGHEWHWAWAMWAMRATLLSYDSQACSPISEWLRVGTSHISIGEREHNLRGRVTRWEKRFRLPRRMAKCNEC